MQHVSIYFHEDKKYPCPDCTKEMSRAHIHGWFYYCVACRKTYPLYVLDKQESKIPEPTVEEPKKKGLFDKVKEVLHVQEKSS